MNKINIIKLIISTIAIVTIAMLTLNSCNQHGNKLTDVTAEEIDDNEDINVLDQARQTIIVLPNDQLLEKSGCLTTTESMGKTIYHRDYNRFLLASNVNQQIINTIQNNFSEIGFPLINLEQSLKSLQNTSLTDEADGLEKDAKTLLLTTSNADIIIEFDYTDQVSMISRNKMSRNVSYNISVLDAFSNKSIGSISETEVDGDIDDDLATMLNDDIKGAVPKLTSQIQNYYTDLLKHGREITFRVSMASGATITLQDMYNRDGETYSDWIREWVKTNAKRGAATMQRNTKNEIYFVNVRIKNLNEDGTQYNAYDFANSFRKEFYKTFGVQINNNTQNLSVAHLVIAN